jgi:hypothetical protein
MSLNSVNLKTTVLILSLLIVPIVVLFCILAVAVACSEVWSSRPRRLLFWKRAKDGGKRNDRSNPPRTSTSTKSTDCTETDLEYLPPVEGREHV